MAAVFPKGTLVKAIKSIFSLKDEAYIVASSTNPQSTASNAPRSSIYLYDTGSRARFLLKRDDGSSTNWTPITDDVLISVSGDTVADASGNLTLKG